MSRAQQDGPPRPVAGGGAAPLPDAVRVAVIGAGQAGLSAAYHLQRRGLEPGRDFALLDENPAPGGAWQHRWPSLTLSNVNRINDLPGLPMAQAGSAADSIRASAAVPAYYAAYEERLGLRAHRPVSVDRVREDAGALRLELRTPAGPGALRADAVVSATGTWDRPYVPYYPGAAAFGGRQLHTHDYRSPGEFAGQRVAVVGGGISAVQLLQEIAQVAEVAWFTRRPPEFTDREFTPELGHAVIARVEERVRRGERPGSVVSNTALPLTPGLRAARAAGILTARPMFAALTGAGVVQGPGDARPGQTEAFDAILWCTGFRFRLDHLAPLRLREPGGGVRMDGRLATRVARDHRIHLPGYGPTASTIGANRAGRAVARELMELLGA